MNTVLSNRDRAAQKVVGAILAAIEEQKDFAVTAKTIYDEADIEVRSPRAGWEGGSWLSRNASARERETRLVVRVGGRFGSTFRRGKDGQFNYRNIAKKVIALYNHNRAAQDYWAEQARIREANKLVVASVSEQAGVEANEYGDYQTKYLKVEPGDKADTVYVRLSGTLVLGEAEAVAFIRAFNAAVEKKS